MAVGLGSMDMPVPSVAEWEWLNWKFPKAVHAGETIYARWTLTQKRAPVGGAPTAIVVWRVDVHTANGALCAEGEVGASVLRKLRTPDARSAEPSSKARAEPAAAAASSTVSARRGRRRRRTPAGDGAKNASEAKAAVAAVAPVQAPVPAPPASERSATGPRRRRRRRSPGSAAARNGDAPAPAAQAEAAPPAGLPPAVGPAVANPLTRVMRRLRGT